MKTNKQFKVYALYFLAVGGVLFAAFHFGLFVSWRDRLTDLLFIDTPANPALVIVGIDDESLQALGRWPWSRDTQARLIDMVSSGKPAVIGLDVNYPEKSDEDGDTELSQAIKKSGRVVLPIEGELRAGSGRVEAYGLLEPITLMREAGLASGVTNTPLDNDGIFRALPTKIASGNRMFEPFSLVIAKKYLDFRGVEMKPPPVDGYGRAIMNYYGKPGTIRHVSAAQVFDGAIKPEEFRDKIVLIGATAPDLHDEVQTPVSQGMPMSGVEVHANAVGMFIDGRYLAFLPVYWQWLLILACLLLPAVILLFIHLPLRQLWVLLAGVGYLLFVIALFEHGIVADILYPLLALVSGYFVTMLVRYLHVEHEKKYLKNVFSHYLAPEVISELLENPAACNLGGEKRNLTIMFSDIRGFTSISEKLPADRLTSLLNNYLTVMADVVLDSGGVVDKFIGDAIMAFWGAPIIKDDHAARACESALRMMEVLRREQPHWQEEFGAFLNIGIGLNTGEVLLGNLGSEKRFDYTVIGDHVNLGSRLEGLNKIYGTNIIVSEATKGQAGDGFAFRLLDLVAVKGKAEAVRIYELVGRLGEIDEAKSQASEIFETALRLYWQREWHEAEKLFESLRGRDYEMLIDLYIGRCQANRQAPPPEDWDGAAYLHEK